ncbi:MAG TPA: hypothetical protein PLN21_21540 [Gemmatales bacterium]|nr:hypothetical protein [Gemmatales bacterium]
MEYDRSFLGREPKIQPIVALILGVLFIPLGYVMQGAIGGGFEGAGIALIIMSLWDFIRLRLYARKLVRLRVKEQSKNKAN